MMDETYKIPYCTIFHAFIFKIHMMFYILVINLDICNKLT